MERSKRRILIIIPSLVGGGAERVLINLFKLIDLNKFEIELFVGISDGILEKHVPKEIKINHIFPNKLIEKIVYYLYVKLGCKFQFKVFGRRIKSDYNVGMSFLDSFYSEFLFQNRASIGKKIIIVHSSYRTYKNKFKNFKGAQLGRLKERYKNVDVIVSVANEAMNEFKSIFGEYDDMRVIYNPLNVQDILNKANASETIKLNKNKINLIAVGSHIPVKGYDKLIKSCAILKKKNLKFNLNILGTGFLKGKHENLIKELELNDCVTLMGFEENPYKWIKASDIFVMTSEAEGLPTALCEALLLGKPVLVTNVPGCREVVDNGSFGLIVENTVEGISIGLENFILHESVRNDFAKKAIERSAIFVDQIAIKKYVDLFEIE